MGLRAMLSRLAQRLSRPWQPPDIDWQMRREVERRQDAVAERAVDLDRLRERIDWQTGRDQDA